MAAEAYVPEEWEGGLRCAACMEPFAVGQPIAERLDGFQGDVPMVVVTCVGCDLAGAPLHA